MQELFAELREADDTYRYEKILKARGYHRIGGCDEAGRGPLAGPVVAACVILPDECDHGLLQDSKILSAGKRHRAYDYLQTIDARIGVGIVSAATIDRINILQASLLAMQRAVLQLHGSLPDFLLVDGKFCVPLELPQQPLVKGESRSCTIAAASIIAKVERDRLMGELHNEFPLYDFSRHKGYPTRRHRQLLKTHGPCPAHRRTFRGVREHCE